MNNEISSTSANEDLMKEHGILNRILLIYEEIIRRLKNNIIINHKIINVTAKIIQKFIENYHEKTEENYVFPLLISKNILVNEINELLLQHKLGKQLTENIINLTKKEIIDKDQVIFNIENFIKMYRIHEAREDTVIFPHFKAALSRKEYDEMGEKFEEEEHKVLGKQGFEETLKVVEIIEKYLDIYDLSIISNKIKQNIKK